MSYRVWFGSGKSVKDDGCGCRVRLVLLIRNWYRERLAMVKMDGGLLGEVVGS